VKSIVTLKPGLGHSVIMKTTPTRLAESLQFSTSTPLLVFVPDA